MRPIGGKRRVLLRGEQAGQDDVRAAARAAAASGRQAASSGASRILAKHQIERRACLKARGAQARLRAEHSTSGATPLRRAFSRAMRTASGSMSLASTGTRNAFAAAMASTPVPVPMSRMRRGRRALQQSHPAPAGSRASCRDGRCRRRARPRSRCRSGLAQRCARSCAPCTVKRPAVTGFRSARLAATQSFAAICLERHRGCAVRPLRRSGAAPPPRRAGARSGSRRSSARRCLRRPRRRFRTGRNARKASRRGVLAVVSSQTRRATVVFPLLFMATSSSDAASTLTP